MAQRYGGQFSPDPQPVDEDAPQRNNWHGKTRSRAGGRVNLLFIVPLPLALRAFFLGSSTGLALTLLALGLLIGAAWMTREGLIAEDAYLARQRARRPALPRKLIGSALTGLGLAVAVLPGGNFVSALILGVLGAALHLAAFGADPLRDKGMEGIDTFQQDRVARAVDEAETHLATMSQAIARTGDRVLMARVETFQVTARDMFRTVEEDPRDLTAARRFLGVYLLGARDAALKYVGLWERNGDSSAWADFVALLDDLEQSFSEKTRTMLLDDRADLDIEIEVLRDRLTAEVPRGSGSQ